MKPLQALPAEQRLFWVLTGTALVALVVHASTLRVMMEMWDLQAYAHGWIIGPVALYLLWQRRQPLSAVPVSTSLLGVVLTGLLGLAVFVSKQLGIQVGEQLAVTLLVSAFALAVLGRRVAWAAAFPLLFLVASVPIGEDAVPWMMQMTADISIGLLRITGVPFESHGMFIDLTGGSFEVAIECSGLKYLVAGVITALLFADQFRLGLVQRVFFVAGMAALCIVGNGVRAYLVMVIASASNMTLLIGADHLAFGWVFFGLLIAIGCAVGSRLADTMVESASGVANAQTTSRAAFTRLAAVMALLLPIGLPLALEWRLDASSAIVSTTPRLSIDAATCQPTATWPLPWQPRIVGGIGVIQQGFRCGDYHVGIVVQRFAGGSQGDEAVSTRHELVPFDWRRVTTRDSIALAGTGGLERVERASMQLSRVHAAATSWYVVDGVQAAGGSGVKLLELMQLLRGSIATTDLCFVGVSGPGADGAQRLLSTVATTVVADLGNSKN